MIDKNSTEGSETPLAVIPQHEIAQGADTYPGPELVERMLATAEAFAKAQKQLTKLAFAGVKSTDLQDFGGKPYFGSGAAKAIARGLHLGIEFVRNPNTQAVHAEITELDDDDCVMEVTVVVTGWNRPVTDIGTSGTNKAFWQNNTKLKGNYFKYLSDIIGTEIKDTNFDKAVKDATPGQIRKAKHLLRADVKKQAMANAVARGVMSWLGSDPTWPELEPFGLAAAGSGKDSVAYGGDSAVKVACPKCGQGTMQTRARKSDGATFYGCSNFPDCKNIMQPTVYEAAVKAAAAAQKPDEPKDSPQVPTGNHITKALGDELTELVKGAGLTPAWLKKYLKEQFDATKLSDLENAQWRDAVVSVLITAANNMNVGDKLDEYVQETYEKSVDQVPHMPQEQRLEIARWIKGHEMLL